MDFEKLVAIGVRFFHSHTVLAILLVVVLLVFSYLKPKQLLKLLIVGLVLGVAFYFLSLTAKTTLTGVQHEEEMIYKSEKLTQ